MNRYNIVSDNARFYERVSIGALIPEHDFASQVGMNGSVVLGVEYFPNEKSESGRFLSFFGEFGVSAPFAYERADRVAGSPKYSQGVLTLVGTRCYF